MRTYTISEAAAATGTTPKALRRRIERGTLRAVLGADQLRRIPLSELERAGLHPRGHAVGQLPPPGQPAPDLSAIVERLEQLARENGRLRALEQHAGSHAEQLERDLLEARARILELEAAAAAALVAPSALRLSAARRVDVLPVGYSALRRSLRSRTF